MERKSIIRMPQVSGGALNGGKARTCRLTEGTERLRSRLTLKEQYDVVFTPLILGHLAWLFAWRAQRYCRERRLEGFKKASREVDRLRNLYVTDAEPRALSPKEREAVEKSAMELVEQMDRDLRILWYSVNGAILRDYPDLDHDVMRTDAYISILMALMLRDHENKVSRMLADRFGCDARDLMNPHIEALAEVMLDYSGRVYLRGDRHVGICRSILRKNIVRIRYRSDDGKEI